MRQARELEMVVSEAGVWKASFALCGFYVLFLVVVTGAAEALAFADIEVLAGKKGILSAACAAGFVSSRHVKKYGQRIRGFRLAGVSLLSAFFIWCLELGLFAVQIPNVQQLAGAVADEIIAAGLVGSVVIAFLEFWVILFVLWLNGRLAFKRLKADGGDMSFGSEETRRRIEPDF